MSVRESDLEFSELIQRVREGSQQAAWILIEQYSPQILRVVRRRLPEELRSKFDSADFAQAAWASVFSDRSRLMKFSQAEEFVAFMTAVAKNKVAIEFRRRLRSKKNNVSREKSFEQETSRASSIRMDNAQPTPSQIAVARERWFRLMDDQPEHYREIIQMRFQGFSIPEIARRRNLDATTVRRALNKILREHLNE